MKNAVFIYIFQVEIKVFSWLEVNILFLRRLHSPLESFLKKSCKIGVKIVKEMKKLGGVEHYFVCIIMHFIESKGKNTNTILENKFSNFDRLLLFSLYFSNSHDLVIALRECDQLNWNSWADNSIELTEELKFIFRTKTMNLIAWVEWVELVNFVIFSNSQ